MGSWSWIVIAAGIAVVVVVVAVRRRESGEHRKQVREALRWQEIEARRAERGNR